MNRFFDFLVGGSTPGLVTLAAVFIFIALLCVLALVSVFKRIEETCDCPQFRLESQSRDSFLLKTFHGPECRRHTGI
jgi:hypothetical protein